MNDKTCSISAKILKIDDEKRQITGWANVTTNADGTRVVDSQGDMIPVDVLESAAAELISAGSATLGSMHEAVAGQIIESMVVTAEKRKALGFGEGPEGWAITARVDSDEAWADVKSGKRAELSIGGSAERVSG
jgi:hypothetical protein